MPNIQMVKNRNALPIVIGISLAMLFGLAFYLRIGFVYDTVFTGGEVRFTETDAYYHMRLAENMSHHLPTRITFDPYTHYPEGTRIPWPPLFDWLIVGIAWILSAGSPSQHILEIAGAWLPPVLGAVMVIPVYFMGKALFNRWIGLISAALIAIHPGGFLTRSLLGACDHHAAEVLFCTLTMLFLILGIKSTKQKNLTFDKLKWQNLVLIGKPLLYNCLSGLFFGAYLLTWSGGLLLIFILFVYFVVQAIIDHLRGESTDYLSIAALPLFIIGGALSLPSLAKIWTGPGVMFALPIAILTPVVLNLLSMLLTRIKLARVYYPVVVLGLGLMGLALLWLISPSRFEMIPEAFHYVLPRQSTMDIGEAQPLFFPLGKFSLTLAWSQYTTGLLLSLIALGILTYSVSKQVYAERVLLLVWSIMMLLAVMGQSRYSYYLAVNISLLTGYLSWQIIQLFSLNKTKGKPPETSIKAGKKITAPNKLPKSVPANGRVWPRLALGIAIVLLLAFVPNVAEATKDAKQLSFTPDDAWHDSLYWMRDNTPDPFGNPDFYYELYEPPPPDESYRYPDSAYGVMAWWHYGHWITRIAHRIPTSNPFQRGARSAARFFTAQDEASSEAMLNELGVKYVIVDERIATGFFGTATWAGLSESDFYDLYYEPQGRMLAPIVLYHTAYYRSLCVRLYNFEGKEIVPNSCTVISYQENISPMGVSYKTITGSKNFSTYEEAEKYISEQKTGNYKIVSKDPFASPVPLEELKHYRLVYASATGPTRPGVGVIPEVKIFEYER